MSFIQIIEYETDRPDEMQALGDKRMHEMNGKAPFNQLFVTQDRDKPNHYLTIVEFDSYDKAMENSKSPDQQHWAEQMAALCSKPPKFYNLDVQTTAP
ncbi:MAG: hypothetical protein WCA46_07375 [Actinocatenispora sp.]